MLRVAIVGAGTTGLFASLVLSREGHEVVLIEQDAMPAPIRSDNIAAWRRNGTPQAFLPHGLMARGRTLLREHAPDVWQHVLDAGAVEIKVVVPGPPESRVSGDDELIATFCRRPLLEDALWRAVLRQPRIELRAATTVTGVSLPGALHTDGGTLNADLIIDAGGRRSPLPAWLGATDAAAEETGMIYYSRYYALRPGAEHPRGPWLWGPRAELPFALATVHLADRGVHSITYAVPTGDAELKALRDVRAFEAATAALPTFAPWAAEERVRPCTDVLAMGGLQNVLRPFVRDGVPIAPGVIPIGDALCHTNAAYGWGMTIGMEHAAALLLSLRETESPAALALAYAARVWPEAQARWALSSEQDRTRVRAWRGEPPRAEDTRAAAARALAPAVMLDADVFRAVMRSTLLLDPADALLDPALLARAQVALERRGAVPAPPPPPTREAILAAMRAA